MKPVLKGRLSLPSFKISTSRVGTPIVLTNSSSPQVWKGKALAGDDKYTWPIIWSMGLAAAENGMTIDAYKASTINLFPGTMPRVLVPQQITKYPVMKPKAIVFRSSAAFFQEKGLQAIQEAVLPIKTKLQEMGVFVAFYPLSAYTTRNPMLTFALPATTFTTVNDSVDIYTTDGHFITTGNITSKIPDFSDIWLCGDLMIISLSSPVLGTFAIGPYTTAQENITINPPIFTLSNLKTADVAAWNAFVPKFDKVLNYQGWFNIPQLEPAAPGLGATTKANLQSVCNGTTSIFEDLGTYTGSLFTLTFPNQTTVATAIRSQIKTFFGIP